jgi:hypothetical protein
MPETNEEAIRKGESEKSHFGNLALAICSGKSKFP